MDSTGATPATTPTSKAASTPRPGFEVEMRWDGDGPIPWPRPCTGTVAIPVVEVGRVVDVVVVAPDGV